MNTNYLHAFCCLAIMLVTVGCSSGDAANGQARAVTCHACHGGNGMQTTPSTPRLAGQSRIYLAKQLRDFRDGRRKDPTMEPLAASLTDSQIDDIAVYFESLD
jgi:cytochrome c553